jgi:site-specific DNA-methyltransferase (cytosine-N4-specific)
MCGSGTTVCESIAFGRSAAGADMNPLSVLISSVKARAVNKAPEYFSETLAAYSAKFMFRKRSTKRWWDAKDFEYLERWFAAEALAEIAGILGDIDAVSDEFAKDFFRVCLSNILRSCSWQKETDLRVRKEIKVYEKGQAIGRFAAEVERQIEKMHPYLCLLDRNDTPPTMTLRQGNAVQIDRLMPELVGKIDLIITSPPYATALPYLDTDRLSLIVLGLLPRADHRTAEFQMVGTREVSEKQRREWWEYFESRKEELPDNICDMIEYVALANHGDGVGFRRRNLPALLGKYFLDMLDAMRAARQMMKLGAPAYYVVGNNSTMVNGEKMEIQTDDLLFDLGENAGWTKEEMIPMELIPSRDIFRENRGSKESILCFRAGG